MIISGLNKEWPLNRGSTVEYLHVAMNFVTKTHYSIACVAAVSFPFLFQAGKRTSERKSGRAPGVSKNLGRSGEGVSEEGEGVGRKGNACNQSQTFY